VRSALLYSIYSGQLFFGAAALLLVALVAPKRIAGVLAMLAVALAAFSGPLIGTLLTMTAFALWRWKGPVIAASLCLLAVVLELPYHVITRELRLPSRIFVIGDSLASGGFGEAKPWPGILETKLAVPVVNLSLASAGAQIALERQVPELPLVAVKGELVIIEIGGNDMLDGTGAARFASHLDRLLEVTAGHRDVAMLELPLLPGRWLYGFSQRWLAWKHGCVLIPKRVLARVLAAPENTSDGIHLTQRGHEALATALAGAVGRSPQRRRGRGEFSALSAPLR
jgi:acyl-CoA thioesterase I